MPESQFDQGQTVTEIKRPDESLILPDEFIDAAISVNSMEELTKFLNEHLGKTVFEGVRDRDHAVIISKALGLYTLRKDRTWNLQKNVDKDNPPNFYGRRITPDWQRGVEEGMKEVLLQAMRLDREVAIIDYIYKQAESASGHVVSNVSRSRIAAPKS